MRVSVLSYMRAAITAAMLMVMAGFALAAPPDIVYRGTDEPPERVFRDGLRSRGSGTDFYEHVAGNACTDGTTGFVSTTEEEAQAHHFAIRRLMAEDGFAYVYEIRANDRFYSTWITLSDAYSRLRDPRFRAAADRFREEREWLAVGGVPTELIHRVRIYRRNPLTRLAELVETRDNTNYRHEHTVANSQPYRIDRVPRSSTVVVSPSLFGAASSSCLCNISEEAESERRKRSAEGTAPACTYFSITADDMKKQRVIDPITDKEVLRYVPWAVRKQTRGYATTEAPTGCEFFTGAAPLGDTLGVKCSRLPATRFKFLFGAGGRVNTWVDSTFAPLAANGEWTYFRGSAIPVVGTRYTLKDYSYSIYDVLHNTSGDWWSTLTVRPYYPNLPYDESSVCMYRSSGYQNKLACLPPNGMMLRFDATMNDLVRSIHAPNELRYKICEKFDFAGECHILNGNASMTDLNRLGMSDVISSMRACYKPPANLWQQVPRNQGLIGTIYVRVNPASGAREFYQLKKGVYGAMPTNQRSSADWEYLPGYDEC